MSSGWILNIVGLATTTVAAVLMSFFPPRVQLYTVKGEGVSQWISNAKEEKRHLGLWQARLSKLGPLLLILGFAFQLVAAFVSV